MYDPNELIFLESELIDAINSVETSSVPEEAEHSGSDQVVPYYWSCGEDEESTKIFSATQHEDSSFNHSNPMVQNPLYIDLILDNLATFLDYSTLKTARMVCRKWNESFHATFEKKTTINVDLEIFNNMDISYLTRTFNEAAEEGKIYKSWHIKDPQVLHCGMKWWIAAKYGKYIESIKLGPDLPEDDWETIAFVKSLKGKSDLYAIRMADLSSLLFQWCPNLKHLSIPFPRVKGGYAFGFSNRNPVVELITLELGNCNKWFPQNKRNAAERFAQNIIKCVKSVEKLILQSSENKLNLMSFANSLLSEKDKRNCLFESLTTLDLSQCTVAFAAYRILSNVNFNNLKHLKLGKFNYYWRIHRDDLAGFQIFLNKVGLQLESLYLLESRGVCEKVTLQKLEMPALKVLHVDFSHWEVGTFDFVLQLPKLTNLFICFYDWERQDHHYLFPTEQRDKSFQFIDKEHKNLETLTWIDKVYDTDLVGRVVRYFPNLKKIQITPSGEVFCEVLNQLSLLRNLEDLKIWIIKIRSEYLNSALVVNLPFLLELKKLALYFQWEENGNRKLIDVEKLLPNSGRMVTLSVDGVQNGFLKSPKLVSLFLEGFKISNEAYDILMESKIQVTADDYFIDDDDDDYFTDDDDDYFTDDNDDYFIDDDGDYFIDDDGDYFIDD